MAKGFIVTIGREFGTGGRKIATELAQKESCDALRCKGIV